MPAVRVGPDVKLGTHDVALHDGVEQWGIRLEDGPRGIQEVPEESGSARDLQKTQRTWEGGRGIKDLADDDSRFNDSREAWTLTPGRVAPAPKWMFASGINSAVVEDYAYSTGAGSVIYPDSYNQPTDGRAWMAWSFTPSTNYKIRKAGIWGWWSTGSKVTGTVYLSSSGEPDSDRGVISSGAAGTTTAEAPNPDGALGYFEFNYRQAKTSSGAEAGSSEYTFSTSSEYWFELNMPNVVGKPKILTNPSLPSGSTAIYYDVGGTAWVADSNLGHIFFRLFSTVANVERRMHLFELDSALYMADQKDDATNSDIWINGDRGAVSTGTLSTSLIDLNMGIGSSWTADEWANYRVKITEGPGQGQNRLITANSSIALTVSPAWSWLPTTDSEYVVYGGPKWQTVGISTGGNTAGSTVGPNFGDGDYVRDVTVANKTARFGMGSGRAMIRMAHDSTNSDHKWADDGTNTADVLHSFNHPEDGWQTYSGLSTSAMLRRAPSTVGYANSVFTDIGTAGGNDYDLTALTDYDTKLYAMKEDSVWYGVGSTMALHRLNVSLDAMPNSNNGRAVTASDMFLYFSWAFSVERFYGGTLDDIGPWKDEGLPANRQGVVSAIESAFGWLFVGIDAGSTGYSSVLLWNQQGYHEIFRGWEGARVRDLYFQGVEDGNPILWINVGGELVYMKFPKNSLDPLKEDGFEVQPEAIIESGEIQYDKKGSPTFYKEIIIHSENLNSSAWVEVDFQFNEDVGTDTWYSADAVYESPRASLQINAGEVYNFKYRFRLITQDADQIPIVNMVELRGFAREPVYYRWNMRAKVSDLQRTYRGGRDTNPNDFMSFLKNAAKKATRVFVRSKWPQFDDMWVVVEPPTILRTYTTDIPKHQEAAIIPFSVKEG